MDKFCAILKNEKKNKTRFMSNGSNLLQLSWLMSLHKYTYNQKPMCLFANQSPVLIYKKSVRKSVLNFKVFKCSKHLTCLDTLHLFQRALKVLMA